MAWNPLNPSGQREWGVGSFLASACIQAGVCRYAHLAPLGELFYNPQIDARVNLAPVPGRRSPSPTTRLHHTRLDRLGAAGQIDWSPDRLIARGT